MSSCLLLLVGVWGVALVLSLPLLAAVIQDRRRTRWGDEETGSTEREYEQLVHW